MIDVLRHGVVDLGIPVRLAYFKPDGGMNQSLAALYKKAGYCTFRCGQRTSLDDYSA
jgi:hypothetical protein